MSSKGRQQYPGHQARIDLVQQEREPMEISAFKDKQCEQQHQHDAHDWTDVIDPYYVMLVHCHGR